MIARWIRQFKLLYTVSRRKFRGAIVKVQSSLEIRNLDNNFLLWLGR